MKAFWIRIICEPDVEAERNAVDAWTTGYTGSGWATKCFAVRADTEDDAYKIARELFPRGSTEIDFVSEKPWKTYGDFAGPKTRFPMVESCLSEEIDTDTIIRRRLVSP